MKTLDAEYPKTPPFVFNQVRYGVWYGVGLLARNQGNDSTRAAEIFTAAFKYQYKNPADKWYGTFKVRPTDANPQPGGAIYSAYDPNMGLFVSTSFIIALEEFGDLLSEDLKGTIKESMRNATIGDGYRVGGVDRDNLRPPYSNPWYMRVMTTTYVGAMLEDKNHTHWGDVWAKESSNLFNQYNSMSEFNSGTYTGVSLYALSLWGYMPKSSVAYQTTPKMIEDTWRHLGEIWNPTLHTLGGPFDRSFGFDLRKYWGILGAQAAGLLGGIENGTAPVPNPPSSGTHLADIAAFVLTPLTSKFHDPLISSAVRQRFVALEEPHSYKAQAISPPYDRPGFGPRNYTTWTDHGLSVGGLEVDEENAGGPFFATGSFTPGLIQWDTGVAKAYIGWLSYHPSSGSTSAVASNTTLTISYPPSRAWPNTSAKSSVFNFRVSTFPDVPGFIFNQSTIRDDGSASLPGLNIKFTGDFINLANRTVVSSGTGVYQDRRYWTIGLPIKQGVQGVPRVVVEFEKV